MGCLGRRKQPGEQLHTLGKGSFSHLRAFPHSETVTVTVLDKKPVLFCFYFSLGRWDTHVTSEASLSVIASHIRGSGSRAPGTL